jgi:hypothetical protein
MPKQTDPKKALIKKAALELRSLLKIYDEAPNTVTDWYTDLVIKTLTQAKETK